VYFITATRLHIAFVCCKFQVYDVTVEYKNRLPRIYLDSSI